MDNALPHLILASASPRRRDLLREAGVSFVCHPAHVVEDTLPDEAPADTVRRLARAKAAAIAARFPDRLVLGADTLVVLGQTVLGKPESSADAARMLRLLSGHTHEVMTGVSLMQLRPACDITWMARTAVRFRNLTDETIQRYLARVHALDKAGAYAIQEHGELIVDSITGLLSNVIGLPIEEVVARLRELRTDDA
jgi:septum formation protein